ncbi:fluoride efflux transporter FluC [Arthrobacter sp. ZGTC412]|uniref:fluoride efflux transporter FluC n=1 Tax=Arthrobacter sp. ZGTC412 TaxID=2058900 RepID=UPI000CE49D91|nr:CrcB family protein [Arthrobacter sp. ZGTC412]
MKPASLPAGCAWLAVAAGGLVGTELRYGLGLAFPDVPGSMPWGTLWINVGGSFVLAALTTIWMARPQTAFWLRAGLGPGLLGSFTTFSAVVFSVDQLARAGEHLVWVAYLVLSVFVGLAAAGLGWRFGKLVAGRLGVGAGSRPS